MSLLGLRQSTRSSTSTIYLRTCYGIRNMHSVKALPYPVEGGLGNFLPPKALKMIAVEYQQGLLERLNGEVHGTELQNKSVAQTVIETTVNSNHILAHNYAALALNNGFFLECLKPPNANGEPTHQSEIGQSLRREIIESHVNINQFKSHVSAAASGMFSNGWLWFVTDSAGNTGVVSTTGPNSLLSSSKQQAVTLDGRVVGELIPRPELKTTSPSIAALAEMEERAANLYKELESTNEEEQTLSSTAAPVDASAETEVEDIAASEPRTTSPTEQPTPPGVTPASPASGVAGKAPSNTPFHPRFYHSSSVRSSPVDLEQQAYGIYSGDLSQRAPQSKSENLLRGNTLFPLFCIPIYEHAWMSAGYGVWGKEKWLKEFWTVLDWSKVNMTYEAVVTRHRGGGGKWKQRS